METDVGPSSSREHSTQSLTVTGNSTSSQTGHSKNEDRGGTKRSTTDSEPGRTVSSGSRAGKSLGSGALSSQKSASTSDVGRSCGHPGRDRDSSKCPACAHPSDYNDFWLPEFRQFPSMPVRKNLWTIKEEEKKQRASMPVTPLYNPLRNARLRNSVHVKLIDGSSRPPHIACACPACRIIKDAPKVKAISREIARATKEAQAKAKRKAEVTRVEMVDKGPRLGLVLYDKFKPWQRLRVDGCVNPRPLARRLPESVMPETVATFWSSRMHMPGKVIHSQNNQYGKRTRPHVPFPSMAQTTA